MHQGLKYIKDTIAPKCVGALCEKNHWTATENGTIDIGTDHPLSTIRAYHVLSPKECQRIIDEGERMAARVGGWLNKRHKGAPTTDIPFHFWEDRNEECLENGSSILKKISRTHFQKDYNAHFASFNDFFWSSTPQRTSRLEIASRWNGYFVCLTAQRRF